MAKEIFVNLPVKDLKKTMEFFSKLGFNYNPKFTDENAACMLIGENIYAMLLDEKFFMNFTKKPVSDAKSSTEAIICISVNSRDEVDTMVNTAKANGGNEYAEPQDHGWMYYRSFEDPDGHQWEVMFGDESRMPQK